MCCKRSWILLHITIQTKMNFGKYKINKTIINCLRKFMFPRQVAVK